MQLERQDGHPVAAGIRDDLRRGQGEVRELTSEVAGIAEDLRGLVKSEVALAKSEVREQASLVVKSATWGGVAAVAALLTLGWLALTATFALDIALPLWLSALVVAVALGAIAAIAGLIVRSTIKRVTVVPKRTVNSVKEDVAWAKNQLKSNPNSSASATP